MPPPPDPALATLQEHWGYPSFRPGQEEAIAAVLEGRDVLAILPTGGGKSLCYQVPGLVRGGLTLVVSPLIALMQDQVAALNARGIPAAFINSTLSYRAVDQAWTDAEHGRYRFLYVAPERLQTDVFQARAERLPITLFAVDEAHCVSEWGHHFRPDYLKLPEARVLLREDVPCIAVTATATPAVRRDVMEHLALREPRVLVRGFDRPNVVPSVFKTEDKREQARAVLRGVEGSGLVYVATRRAAEDWARWLEREGISAAAYHGGLPHARREGVQEAWIAGETKVVAATNAFGMGIDKPDVRFVLHAELPASVEAYYQEAGRAGRDGVRSYAVLLFHEGDADTQRALIEASHPDARTLQRLYDAACSLGQVPVGSTWEAPIVLDRAKLAEVAKLPLSGLSSAVDLIERQGLWQQVRPRRHDAFFRFEQPADTLRRYAQQQESQRLRHFVRDLLRTLPGDAFSGWWTESLRDVARATGLDRPRLARGLDFLQERGLLSWRAPADALVLQLEGPRVERLIPDAGAVRRAKDRAEARLDAVVRYARSRTCRRQALLTYFGEAAPPHCGACDVCLGRHQTASVQPSDEPTLRAILRGIAQEQARSAWTLAEPLPAYRVDELLDWLVQEGFLTVTHPLEDGFVLTPKARRWL